MQLTAPTPDAMIDLSDKRCPNLVVAIIAALRLLQEGQILQVIATDPNAPSNITAWARQSGHSLLDLCQENEQFVFQLRRGARVSAATPSFRS